MWKWFRNLFRTAGEVASLTRECLFLQKEREVLESRVAQHERKIELLEKSVLAERARKDKFVMQFCNQLSVKNKLYGVFTDSTEETKPKELPQSTLNVFEQEELRLQAIEWQRQDIENGMPELPLEVYLTKMSANPENFIHLSN